MFEDKLKRIVNAEPPQIGLIEVYGSESGGRVLRDNTCKTIRRTFDRFRLRQAVCG